MKSPSPQLASRCCRFCGKSFRPKRKNQKHCRASHRVRDAVRRFWAKNKRDYHVRLVTGRSGKCAFCGKPQVFRSKTAKYCPGTDCAKFGSKNTRSD